MLGDGDPAAGDHKGCSGGNVESPGAIPAGAAGIYHGLGGDLDAGGFAPHGASRSRQFGKGFPLGGESRHDAPDLSLAG